MEFMLDTLIDVAVVYTTAAVASCAWFSYQWYTSRQDPIKACSTSMDMISRKAFEIPPPTMDAQTELQDVLVAAAMAPAHATITVLQAVLMPEGMQPCRGVQIRQRMDGKTIGTIRQQYVEAHNK